MDLKKPVLELRNKNELRGKYPVYVQIPYNMGHIVESRAGYYIVTIKDTNLNFYALSRFRNRHIKEHDFSINLKSFKNYIFNPLGKHMKEIMLINGEDFLPFRFFSSVKTSYEGEANIAYMCKCFDEMGIVEVKRGIVSGNEEETK